MSALRYRYQTVEFEEFDVHYRCLKDLQQYEDSIGEAEDIGISSANWSLFGVVWPSGSLMAKIMSRYDIRDRRILEVGCGIGLASLVLNERLADITATDRHPCASDFLQFNTQLNNRKHIPFFRTSWEDDVDSSQGRFDLILGSDLLYEEEHAKQLALFIQKLATPRCELIMVDAGRQGYANKFSYKMKELGFQHELLLAEDESLQIEGFNGRIHRYSRNMPLSANKFN